MALPSTLEDLMECFREITGKIYPAEAEDEEPVVPLYKLAFSASMINHMTVAVDSASEPHPLTCTQFINSLLLEFLRRKSEYTNPDAAEIQKISDLPTEVVQALKKLCDFAYTNVLEARYTFELDDFESYEISSTSPADTLGLVQTVEIPGIFGPKTKYSFLHQCLQEFLAALHLADLPRKEQIAVVDKLARHRLPTFILPAFAGITRLKNRDVVKVLLSVFQAIKYYSTNIDVLHLVFKASRDSELLLLLLSCVYESQRSDLCQVIADRARQGLGNGFVPCYDFSDTQLLPIDCRAVGHFISKLSNIIIMASFASCYLSDEQIDIFMKPLLNIRGTNVRVLLQFNGNRITHIGTNSICKMIRSSSLMLGLDLKCNWIPPQTDISTALTSLIEALSRNSSVASLNLIGNYITSKHINYLILMLAFCKNLTMLHLGMNNIASAMPLLAASMEQNTSVTEFDLQGCCITNEGLVTLGKSLRRNKILQKLNICDNFFTSAALLSFLSLLGEGSCITELTITSSYEVPHEFLLEINTKRAQAGVNPLQLDYTPPNVVVQQLATVWTPSVRRLHMELGYSSFLAQKQLQLPSDDPTTIATAGPNDTLLQMLCVELRDVTDWHTLGIHLKVHDRELKTIEDNYPRNVKRCKQETLKVWLKTEDINPLNMWKKIVEALRLMDENVVATRLATAYSVSDD